MQGAINILVIGSGGREDALVWKIAMSDLVKKIFCIPGNAGINMRNKVVPVTKMPQNPLAPENWMYLVNFAKENNVTLAVVGPELPLYLGIVNLFRKYGLLICGTTQAATQLESSKPLTKSVACWWHLTTNCD